MRLVSFVSSDSQQQSYELPCPCWQWASSVTEHAVLVIMSGRTLCGSDFSIIYLCAFQSKPSDRLTGKSPRGYTSALLPKPYITHSYKLKQFPPFSMLPCVVLCFFCVQVVSFICRVHQILAAIISSDSWLVCGVWLWRLPASICFWDTNFGPELHFAAEFLFCPVVNTLY